MPLGLPELLDLRLREPPYSASLTRLLHPRAVKVIVHPVLPTPVRKVVLPPADGMAVLAAFGAVLVVDVPRSVVVMVQDGIEQVLLAHMETRLPAASQVSYSA